MLSGEKAQGLGSEHIDLHREACRGAGNHTYTQQGRIHALPGFPGPAVVGAPGNCKSLWQGMDVCFDSVPWACHCGGGGGGREPPFYPARHGFTPCCGSLGLPPQWGGTLDLSCKARIYAFLGDSLAPHHGGGGQESPLLPCPPHACRAARDGVNFCNKTVRFVAKVHVFLWFVVHEYPRNELVFSWFVPIFTPDL